MGGIISSAFGSLFVKETKVDVLPYELGPEADIPDPGSSLTPRQIAYINMTWRLVSPDLKYHGVNFFILFFENYPIIQTRFKELDGKPLEDLIYNKTLETHAASVMTALDTCIATLHDLNAVTEMFLIIGADHKNRGIMKSDFQLLVPMLIQYLKEAIQDAWSTEAEDAWNHLLKLILSLLFSAYNTYDDDDDD